MAGNISHGACNNRLLLDLTRVYNRSKIKPTAIQTITVHMAAGQQFVWLIARPIPCKVFGCLHDDPFYTRRRQAFKNEIARGLRCTGLY
jgi:hypothetical protein